MATLRREPADNERVQGARRVAIDLLCGSGGMSLGLRNAGFDVVFANEINESAAATYRHNFPGTRLAQCDVRELDPRRLKEEIGVPVDLVCSGPPCQGFSTAGKRDPDDPRNKLYINVLRFVKVFHPKVVVIENVTGMLRSGNGKTIANIKRGLRWLGYHPHVRRLVASDFGVPQERVRVFIIASRKDIPEDDLYPSPLGMRITVEEAISDLAFLGVDECATEYRLPATTPYQQLMRKDAGPHLYNHESPRHSARIQERFRSIPVGRNGSSFLEQPGTSKHTYIKLDPSEPSRTITTLPEDFIHYSQNRIPTVREMARIQSFPDDFVFLGPRTTGGPRRKQECPQYSQVGNAIPPRMAQAVFKNLAVVLNKHYRTRPLECPQAWIPVQ